MRNYIVCVTLSFDGVDREFQSIFGKKGNSTDSAIDDSLRFGNWLHTNNSGSEFVKIALHKARVCGVKADGRIESGKGNLLYESDSLTRVNVSQNVVVSTPAATVALDDIRITNENIDSLKPGEIFVFGSNKAGVHGAGAARLALEKFGAIDGQGSGIQGDSYAIPTKDESVRNSLTVDEIKVYVDEFVEYAKQRSDRRFLVTQIGCGYAKFSPSDIAPLFVECKGLDNVSLPQCFWDVIGR